METNTPADTTQNTEPTLSILTSPLSTNFSIKTPKIGLNRKLKKITIENRDTKQNNTSITQNSLSQEQCEELSYNNFMKYKNLQNQIVYTDNEDEFNLIGKPISFNDLVNLIHNDASVIENFIDPSQGEFIENIQPSDYTDIHFDSLFEEGNLRMAIKVDKNEYDLIMRKDFNNEKNYSWFFFEIYSKTEQEIKFNIINFPKKKLLFSNEVRILTYNPSDKWSRNTYNVYYYQNWIPMPINLIDNTNNLKEDDPNVANTQPNVQPVQTYYTTLTFSFKIKPYLTNVPIYFSYCYPYTYSDLQKYLYKLSANPMYTNMIKFSTLNKTICGNPLDIIYISNFTNPNQNKSAICLTARVHPGESNSSYVLEGVINTLLGPSGDDLRNKYIFKIVPMLNPDGVINGNYRNNILGKDLNRLWTDPRNNISPSIFYTKMLISQTKPVFYCDFHGHSSISNSCLYGCSQSSKSAKVVTKPVRFNEERVFMKIFEKYAHFYDKNSSRYTISKAKIRTARAVIYNELNVTMSYCLETSTMSTLKDEILEGFTIDKYRLVGEDFVNCLKKWNNKENFFVILKKIRSEVEEKKKKKSNRKKLTMDVNEGEKTSKHKKKKKLTLSDGVNNKVIYCTFGYDFDLDLNKISILVKETKKKRSTSEKKKNIVFTRFMNENKTPSHLIVDKYNLCKK